VFSLNPIKNQFLIMLAVAAITKIRIAESFSATPFSTWQSGIWGK